MYLTVEEARKKFPDAIIRSGVHIESDAIIKSGAHIGSGTHIGSGVIIRSGAHIESGVIIRSGTHIRSGAHIGSGVIIGSGAHIESDAHIGSGATIGRNRLNIANSLHIAGLGSTKSMTGFMCEDGLIICIGCMGDYGGLNVEGTRKAISEKYKPDHPYFDAVNLIEKWANLLGN